MGAPYIILPRSRPLRVFGSTVPPVDPSAEPFFDSAIHTMLFNPTINSYTSFADAVADGWMAKDDTVVQDVSTNVGGANRILTPDQAGTGKYLNLRYDGIANDGGVQEGHSWATAFTNPLVGKVGHPIYVQYDYRVNGDVDDGTGSGAAAHYVQLKWLELWNSDLVAATRAQFSTSYSFYTNGLPQTLWNFFPTPAFIMRPPANTVNSTMGGQCRAPYMWQRANQWTRATHAYMTKTAGQQDGYARLWHNGTKIVDVSAETAGVPVPGADGIPAGQPWCETYHLDAFFNDDRVRKLTLGGTSAGALWAYSIDYDNLTVFFKT